MVIRTNGSVDVIVPQAKNSAGRLAAIQEAIGADTLDFVSVGRANRTDLVMAVDDNGWDTRTVDHGNGRIELVPTTPRKPVNAQATALYWAVCKPGTTHQIVGDAAILHDGDFA